MSGFYFEPRNGTIRRCPETRGGMLLSSEMSQIPPGWATRSAMREVLNWDDRKAFDRAPPHYISGRRSGNRTNDVRGGYPSGIRTFVPNCDMPMLAERNSSDGVFSSAERECGFKAHDMHSRHGRAMGQLAGRGEIARNWAVQYILAAPLCQPKPRSGNSHGRPKRSKRRKLPRRHQ